MELSPIQIPVHVGISEENLCCTTLDDYIENVRPPQLVQRLSGKNHCRIVFPPGLQCLDNITLNARILQEHPSLINQERFEAGGDLSVGNNGIGSMQDV